MVRERGLLFRGQGEGIPIEFTAHPASTFGPAAYYELHGLTEPLQPDELVVVQTEQGVRIRCQALDHTCFCAVVATRTA